MNLVRDAAALLRQRLEARSLPGFVKDVAIMRDVLALLERHLELVKQEETLAKIEEDVGRTRTCLDGGR